MRGSLVAAAACLSTFAAVAVASAQVSSPAPTPPSAPPAAVPSSVPSASAALLGEVASDPSQTVRTRVGQTFLVALAANRTTGFSWQLAAPPGNAVESVGSAYETRTTLIGGGGQQLWLFRAVAAGTATLTLRYVRPFEHGSKIERAVTFGVDVAP